MVNRDLIYKYLGYNEKENILTSDIKNLVEDEIIEVEEKITPKCLFSTILPVNIGKTTFISDLELLGEDIKLHLKGSTHAVLFAATLGVNIDKLIRKYEQTSMTKVVIIDAICNVIIEEFADEKENEYRDKLKTEGLYLTERYSPGYGDLPISSQSSVLSALDAQRKIGLTVTNSGIMIPRKSITAILGISNIPVVGHKANCSKCVLEGKCAFKKRGQTCY